MSWVRQVFHVARKDVRFARWFVAAYALAIVLTVGSSVSWRVAGMTSFALGFLVIILGCVLVAVAVQEDSPAGAEAFWVTRPLAPSAVLGAKALLAAVVVIGLGLVGQWVVLLAGYDVPADWLPALLGKSAMAYGSIILVAGALATITSDLRSVFLLGILLIVLDVVASALNIFTIPPGASPWIPWFLGAVVVLGWAMVPIHQYVTRRMTRGRWIAAAVVAVSLVPVAAGQQMAEFPSDLPGLPRALAPETLGLYDFSLEDGELRLQIRIAGLDPTHTYQLRLTAAWVIDDDGKPLRLESTPDVARLGGGQVPAPDGLGPLTWLNPQDPTTSFRLGTQGVPISDHHARLLRQGAPLRVAGQLIVMESRIRASLPLQVGAGVVANGQRIRITGLQDATDDALIRIRRSVVMLERPASSGIGLHGRESTQLYFLRNGREALMLHQAGSTGNSGGLVVLGPPVWTEETRFSSSRMREQVVPDPAWLRDAELVIAEWVPVGSSRVVLERR